MKKICTLHKWAVFCTAERVKRENLYMIKKCEKQYNIGCFFVPLNEKGVKMRILICDRKCEKYFDKVCDVQIYKYRLFFVTLNEIKGEM